LKCWEVIRGPWSTMCHVNLYIYFEIVGRLSPRILSQNVGEVIVNLPHIFDLIWEVMEHGTWSMFHSDHVPR